MYFYETPGREMGMETTGSVDGIFVTPDSGEQMEAVDAVEAVAGRGLRGDRYFHERGLYDRREDLPEATDVTLIEMEALEAARRDEGMKIEPRKT